MQNHLISYTTRHNNYNLVNIEANTQADAIAKVSLWEGVTNVASASLDEPSASLQEQSVKDIFKTYPKAVKVTEANVKVGDIIVNHMTCGCLVVTEDMLGDSLLVEWFYKVGETQNLYALLGRAYA